jgi:hypothetical protein
MKWEYDILPVKKGDIAFESLDDMGKDGWELVTIYGSEAIFKRPVVTAYRKIEDSEDSGSSFSNYFLFSQGR